MKKGLKRGDIVIIAVVLLTAAVVFAAFTFMPRGASSDVVVITYDNGTRVVPAGADQSIDIDSRGYHLEIEVKNGAARVASSNCPDKTCVHSGSITGGGRIIACVPAGVCVRVGAEEGDYDFVAG